MDLNVAPALQRFVKDAEKLVAASGGVFTVTSGRRTSGQQTRLYRRYLQGAPGLYQVAPPGYSKHEKGLAIDAITSPRWMLYALGERWRQAGGVWGGDEDPVHFALG